MQYCPFHMVSSVSLIVSLIIAFVLQINKIAFCSNEWFCNFAIVCVVITFAAFHMLMQRTALIVHRNTQNMYNT